MVEQRLASGMLVLVCAESGAEIETHALYTTGDLQRAHGVRLLLYCPGCRKEHIFKFSEGRLDPTSTDDD